MTDILEQLAQSCTFTTISGRLTQVVDEGASTNRLLLRKGSIVDAKYEIVALIGEGGMGAIYKVHHLMLDKEMALKTFRSHGLSPESWHRFQREAQAIARLDHENIVDVFDFGITQDNLPYYTMELLTGQSLSDELKQSGRTAPAAALKIFRQLAAALAHAHRQNIVHRDIKPGNIFLLADNPGQGSQHQAKLVDFGIAKLAENTVLSDELSLTKAGAIFGSPLYMSPEQSLGLPTDLRTDMYSFGCSLYHALTGTPPFVGKTAFLTITLHQTKAAPSLQDSGINFVFPQRLEKLIARLLAKKPENRFENFDEIEAELRWCRRAIQNERSIPADANTLTKMPTSGFPGKDSLEAQPKSPNTSNRLLAILAIAAVGLMTMAVFIACGLFQNQASKPTKTAPAQSLSKQGSFLIDANDKTKTFRFPDDRFYGSFKFEGGTVNCTGVVKVPADAKLLFVPGTIFQEQAELFRRFGPNDLHGIKLHYDDTPWQEQHIEAICSLKGLKQLNLIGLKEVKLSTINLIDKLENLRYLNLSESVATSEDLIHLRLLPKIEFLRVSGVTDLPLLFRFLASHHAQTKALVANSSALTESDFLTITKIKSLIYFSAHTSKITNEILSKVEVAPHWQGLNLMGNPINDGAIDSLSKYKDLQYINLNTHLFSKAGLEKLKAKLPPNCKILDLDGFQFEDACSSIVKPLE